MTYPTRSQRPIAESGRADNSDEETTDVMEPTSSQRGAEPVDAAADPSTRAVMPDDGQQPDQKPHPDEYPHAGDNQQADPETSAERGPEPPTVRRNLPPPLPKPRPTQTPTPDTTRPTSAPGRIVTANSLRATSPTTRCRFVDDPHAATGEAAGLVEEAVQSRTDAITAQKQTLNGWQSADSDDTEVVRVAMRRYRDFIDHLVDL